MDTVYLNQRFLPLDKASVSVTDRGFLFGDGVYEVIPCYAGKLFRFEQHMQRLDRSLKAIGIESPMSHQDWLTIANQLIEKNQVKHGSVYLQITRGVESVRDHRFPQIPAPTVFARMTQLPGEKDRPSSTGVKLVTFPDIRWKRCDIKAITLLANCMARQYAEEQGGQEALMVNQGFAIEGSASNVFMISSDTLITAPKSEKILGGITRDLVIEIALENQWKVEERLFTVDELHAAEEVWITSSTREIQPVWWVDDVEIANAKTGSRWYQMIDLYMAFKQQLYGGKIN